MDNSKPINSRILHLKDVIIGIQNSSTFQGNIVVLHPIYKKRFKKSITIIMNSYELPFKISQFWEWFADNEHRFRNLTNAKQVTEDLNNQVLEFGLFAWHLEKGLFKKHIFTISPNGDSKLLEMSKSIIKAAPPLKHWTFQYCLPPKKWNFKFEAYNNFMIKQQFDASKWEYVLLEKRNKHIKLLIKATNMAVLDADDQIQAARMVVTHILGEEDVIDFVDFIEVVDFFPPKHQPYREPMTELEGHFEEIMEDDF